MKEITKNLASNLIRVDNIIDINIINKYTHYLSNNNTENWELCYVISDTLPCSINSTQTIINANQFILLPPNTEHEYTFSINSNVVIAHFQCLSTYINPIAVKIFNATDKMKSTIESMLIEFKENYLIYSNAQAVKKMNSEVGTNQMLCIFLESLLILTLRENEITKIVPVSNIVSANYDKILAEQIKNYCTSRVNEKIRLEEISEKFNISISCMCKIYKRIMKQSIIDYVVEIKIEQAKQLLRSTNNSATNISAILGFTDPKYFNTLFKKRVGMSPLAYRNKVVPLVNN